MTTIISFISSLFAKTPTDTQIIEPKKKRPASSDPYLKFTISSDYTKIELTEEFITEMKNDEDFQPKFHEEFMEFISRYEGARFSYFSDIEAWQLANEIFDRWIISIKIHPLSTEYFEERKAICTIISSNAYLFRDRFKARFFPIFRNRRLFEDPEKTAIHRSYVIWGTKSGVDCDELEKCINIPL